MLNDFRHAKCNCYHPPINGTTTVLLSLDSRLYSTRYSVSNFMNGGALPHHPSFIFCRASQPIKPAIRQSKVFLLHKPVNSTSVTLEKVYYQTEQRKVNDEIKKVILNFVCKLHLLKGSLKVTTIIQP